MLAFAILNRYFGIALNKAKTLLTALLPMTLTILIIMPFFFGKNLCIM
jgi:hypothetical protein